MRILSQVVYKHDIITSIKPGSPKDQVNEFCFAFLAQDSPSPSGDDVVDGKLAFTIAAGFSNYRGAKQTRTWIQAPHDWSYAGFEIYNDIQDAWQNILKHEEEIKKVYPRFKPEEIMSPPSQSLWYLFEDIFEG